MAASPSERVVGVVARLALVRRAGPGRLPRRLVLGVRLRLRLLAEDGVLVLRLVEERAAVLVVRGGALHRLLAVRGGLELERLGEELDGLLHRAALDGGDALFVQHVSLGAHRRRVDGLVTVRRHDVSTGCGCASCARRARVGVPSRRNLRARQQRDFKV